MGWELVKDGEKVKCWLNLDEIEKRGKGQLDWKNSVGKKLGVRYQWINDEVEERWFIIKDYYINSYLILLDKNKNQFKINSGSLCSGALGRMFDKFTDKFKYNIGSEINGLKIIDREYRKNKNGRNYKHYQYQCEKCGNIDWICEDNLKRGNGCNVCTNKKVIKGVNDIATTNPELIKYFVNQEDVYKYTASSNKKVLLKCPDCDHQKEMIINTLHRQGFGCNKCSDGISYPEKFMVNILSQLNIKFITQLNHTTFNWCCKFRYDFYLPDCNIIIETHGGQHYEGNGFKTYEEVHENDLLKYNLARSNGFEYNKNYFVIDSRESTLEWMKKNIIETLGHVFDFNNIDWEKADLECQKSHMILACQLKKENPDLTTTEIIELIKKEIGIEYTQVTIRNWLNRGNKLGSCYYNPKEEQIKSGKKMSGKKSRSKKVKQKDLNGNIIKIWDYAKQISEELGYNYSTLMNHIMGKDKGKPYEGYIWGYCE